MLSNRGATKAGLMVIFFIIAFVSLIYCIILLGGGFNWSSKSSSNSYETELINAANKYINDYYKNLGYGEIVMVKLSTLKSLNYIRLDGCRGYAIVTKENTLKIEPYLKCSDYESKNYNSEYE